MELVDIHQSLGRVEGKLDSLNDNIKRIMDRQDKNEVRITKLEKQRSYLMGVCGAISVAIPSAMMHFFKH